MGRPITERNYDLYFTHFGRYVKCRRVCQRQASPMKIVLDVMGGDHAPRATVHGGVWAARDFGIQIQLVGDPSLIQAELRQHDISGLSLPIIPASQVIDMDDTPTDAVKAKPESSMVVGMQRLKRGETDAFVTAGNTGGGLAAALLHLGRIPGVKRPAISITYPTSSRLGLCVVLDVGANADCKPEYLYQFGLMGSLYAERALGITRPRVAILSNGEEPGKGNLLVLASLPLLQQAPFDFIGNVEGKDVPAGAADVVVTDGFTGNVFLKTSEGVARLLINTIKSGVRKRPLAKVGALLMKSALSAAARQLDYREFGGAVLLGVDGAVVIGHGRSDAYAVRNAIRLARQTVEGGVVDAIKRGLAVGEAGLSS
jgi:glycerol-3-phosphate acyltransferase PlsX